HAESSGFQTKAELGMTTISMSFVVDPETVTGGVPGPKAPAGTVEESLARGRRDVRPTSSSEWGSPVMPAAFQKSPPEASSGIAVLAPAMDRLTGPTPVRPTALCAKLGRAEPRIARPTTTSDT